MKFQIRIYKEGPIIELVPDTLEEMQTLGAFAEKQTLFRIQEYKGYRDVRAFNMVIQRAPAGGQSPGTGVQGG